MVYTYTGKNSFQLSKKLDSAVKYFAETHGDLSIERIDASEASADFIIQAAQSLPFLVDKKMVIIRNPSANAELLERIPELVSRVDESVDFYFVDQSFDKRKSYYKDLKKHSEITEFKPAGTMDISNWVVEYAKQNDGSISRRDAEFLVERVGADQLLLSQELDKTLLYDSKISRDTIELLTDESVLSSVFALIDAAFQGKSARVIELYREQRAARVDPSYIIAMLTWQLHALALAVYAEPKAESTLVGAGQSSFSAQKSLRLAQNVTKPQLEQYIVSLAELDSKIKSSSVDADAALELFLVELTTS